MSHVRGVLIDFSSNVDRDESVCRIGAFLKHTWFPINLVIHGHFWHSWHGQFRANAIRLAVWHIPISKQTNWGKQECFIRAINATEKLDKAMTVEWVAIVQVTLRRHAFGFASVEESNKNPTNSQWVDKNWRPNLATYATFCVSILVTKKMNRLAMGLWMLLVALNNNT